MADSTDTCTMAETRRCCKCEIDQGRAGFSKKQWKKAPRCRCMSCIGVVTAPAHSISGFAPPLPVLSSAPSAAFSGSEVQLPWPEALPIPSETAEDALLWVLFPRVDFRGSQHSLESDLRWFPPFWEDMSSHQQKESTDICERLGFDLAQAMGLRKTVYIGRIRSRRQLAENVWLVSLGCSAGPPGQRYCADHLHHIQLGFYVKSLF